MIITTTPTIQTHEIPSNKGLVTGEAIIGAHIFKDLFVAIRIEEFAEPAILDEFGIRDPHELTGLYQGVPLIHESVTWPSTDGPLIFLYRQPILAEWRDRGDVGLEELIAHVFIHELGHHFGWSDAEMDVLLDEAD